jgi:hypothetical protein
MHQHQMVEIADLLLQGSNPREAARLILNWLLERHGARSIGLWRTETDKGLTLELGTAIDQRTIDSARALWASDPSALEAGHCVMGDGAVFVPIRTAGVFVYVDGVDARRLDLAALADAATVAAKALQRTANPTTSASLVSSRREELVALLRFNEWTIARVARIKGVTRKTIYDWLARYEIEREKVIRS